MIRWLLAVLLLLVVAAPASGQSTDGLGDAPVYRLDTGDELRVIVFDEEDLSGEFDVNVNGVVSLPLIGDVEAQGLTLTELERAIDARLRDGYVLQPRISIEVLNYRPFYILGEVNEPGGYPYVAGMTVLNAVALAGGYTYRARKERILIQRGGVDRDDAVEVGEHASVLPGDIITVNERFF